MAKYAKAPGLFDADLAAEFIPLGAKGQSSPSRNISGSSNFWNPCLNLGIFLSVTADCSDVFNSRVILMPLGGLYTDSFRL